MRRSVTPDLRCPGCRLHRAVCVCRELPVVPTRTRVVLVLHQRDAWKSSNTGRLALRCLPNSVVVAQGRLPPGAAEGQQLVTGPPYPWQGSDGLYVLLFPDAEARPIEEWRGRAVTLVVLDGTWAQAARARRRFPGLLDLPAAVVPPGAQLHKLRHDPRPGRLGTMEALARALGALEGAQVQAPLERILGLVVKRVLSTRARRPERG